jgi:hypothetical protein
LRAAGVRTWLIAAISLIFAATALQARHLLPDSYYALYAGRYIVAHGIPHVNVVTAVAHGAPWIDQQWLAQVLYYAAWAVGGYAALVVVSSALVTAGFGVLAVLMLRRGVPPIRMFAWTLAAFAVSSGYAAARAQSFGYLFLALTLWLIVRDAEGSVTPERTCSPVAAPVFAQRSARAQAPRGRTWLVIGVLVAWANTHGSVLLGAGLVAAYATYRAVRASIRRHGPDAPDRALLPAVRYLVLGVAAVASVLCTPYGLEVITYYRSLIGNNVLADNVGEWAPPNPREAMTWAFFIVLVVVVVLVAIAWRRGARPDSLLLAIGVITLALALTAFRNVPWFGFGGSLLAADTLARRADGRVPALGVAFRLSVAGLLAGLAVVILVVATMTPAGQFDAWVPRRAIDVAAAVAARHPTWRVLDDQWSAVGMLWLHPGMFGRIAFDVRVEQYQQADMGAFFDFMQVRGPRWQRVIKGYDLIVVSRLWHADLARALARLPGWRVVYSDPDGLVLVRGGA